MKVQLIVVQGKPEGKVIPLVGSSFKIGRGERCQLRPNSEEVSREHAEFLLSDAGVKVRDLGSRNGTLVNGKAVKEAYVLKDRDLVQVGPLTFAVSILEAPASSKSDVLKNPGKVAPEDVSHDDIEAWLIADAKNPAPERPSGVYGGDTITINAYKDSQTTKPSSPTPPAAKATRVETPAPPKPATPAPAAAPAHFADQEFEQLAEGEGDPEDAADEIKADEDQGDNGGDDTPAEEYLDESNPFYVKKKGPAPAAPTKPVFADTSDAARDILSKMMERKRGPR